MELRDYIYEKISSAGKSATEQLVSSLLESLCRSSPEIVGDTDTLLVGLLNSGSYTIDMLETAAVDPRFLLDLSIDSAGYWDNRDSADIDGVKSLFSSPTVASLLNGDKKLIETSDLLKAAVSPYDRLDPSGFEPFDLGAFPHEEERDKTRAVEPLSTAMREMLTYLISTMHIGVGAREIRRTLTQRRTPVTRQEDIALDRRLGYDYPTMTVEMLDFAISALNRWFDSRTILTEPATHCLGLVSTCASVLYGPKHFADAGGDLKVLNSCLALAKKFNPERDLNHLCIFDNGDGIHVGQYTYRNTIATTFRDSPDSAPIGLSVEAIRPVSFLACETVREFESLLSDRSVSENSIQVFLESHPAFFQAMGYVRAIPHVLLREDGRDDMIPDFILQLPGNRGFDILDLKLPNARLWVANPYPRVSSEISKAIAQLKAYKDFFDKPENRRRFQKSYGLEAFRPEVCVVVGRQTAFQDMADRKTLEELMGLTKLYTYDDVIDYGRSRALPAVKGIRGR